MRTNEAQKHVMSLKPSYQAAIRLMSEDYFYRTMNRALYDFAARNDEKFIELKQKYLKKQYRIMCEITSMLSLPFDGKGPQPTKFLQIETHVLNYLIAAVKSFDPSDTMLSPLEVRSCQSFQGDIAAFLEEVALHTYTTSEIQAAIRGK
jgi:hypothetical protein